MRDTHVHIHVLNLKISTIENGVSPAFHVRMIAENGLIQYYLKKCLKVNRT